MKTSTILRIALASLLIALAPVTHAAENKGRGGGAAAHARGGGGGGHARAGVRAGGHIGGGARAHVGRSGGGARVHVNRGPRVGASVQRQHRTSVNRSVRRSTRSVHRNAVRNRAVVRQHQRNVTRSTVRNREAVRNRNIVQSSKNARGRRLHFSNAQRSRLRSFYRGHRGRFHRVVRVPWPVVIGGYVPRDYTVYDIPDDFYGYVPGYEGYKYIIVGDQLIIIDPDTLEIVAIIPLY